MPFESVAEQKGEYIHLRTTGTLASVDEVDQYVHIIRKEALKRDLRKILIDERGLQELQDTQEAHECSEADCTTLVALAGIRVACLCHPDGYELNQAYETFLRNRSVSFKVFLKESEAVAWLNA